MGLFFLCPFTNILRFTFFRLVALSSSTSPCSKHPHETWTFSLGRCQASLGRSCPSHLGDGAGRGDRATDHGDSWNPPFWSLVELARKSWDRRQTSAKRKELSNLKEIVQVSKKSRSKFSYSWFEFGLLSGMVFHAISYLIAQCHWLQIFPNKQGYVKLTVKTGEEVWRNLHSLRRQKWPSNNWKSADLALQTASNISKQPDVLQRNHQKQANPANPKRVWGRDFRGLLTLSGEVLITFRVARFVEFCRHIRVFFVARLSFIQKVL